MVHASVHYLYMESTNAPKVLAVGYHYEIVLSDGTTLTAKITNRMGRVYRVKTDGKLRLITLNHVASATRLD
jgi:hypothetical protein